jgi:hypothetical protein
MPDPPEQFAGLIAEYEPEIAALAEAALAALRARLPGAVEMVYDNYNALVIGFGPTSGHRMRWSRSRCTRAG